MYNGENYKIKTLPEEILYVPENVNDLQKFKNVNNS